jgi:hypothetical protein
MSSFRLLSAVAAVVLLLAACGRGPVPTTLSAQLAGENENPPVATAASGNVNAVLTGNTLVVTGSFSGLMSDLREIAGSSAHVHAAPAGANGPIVAPLVVTSTDARSGQLAGTLTLTDEQRQAFESGAHYVNIHTVGNPSGELRAQLVVAAPTFAAVTHLFDASLLPGNEVHDVVSDASGSATGVLRADGKLTVSGSFASLESMLQNVGDIGPAHIHGASAGANGPVVFPLDVAADEARTSGRFGITTGVSAAQIETLLAGGMYVNVHTAGYPAGEVRGQLFPTTLASTTTLSGANEVPPVATDASGTATATMDGFDLFVEGSFAGLTGVFTVGHIHAAPAGTNGAVVFPLVLEVDTEQRGGTYTVEAEMTEAQRARFLAGDFYVNIHSTIAPGGEIRGQFDVFDGD